MLRRKGAGELTAESAGAEEADGANRVDIGDSLHEARGTASSIGVVRKEAAPGFGLTAGERLVRKV